MTYIWGSLIPRMIGRFWPFLGRSLLRTPQWNRWPRIEMLGGVSILLFSFFIGATHLGHDFVVTESLPFLIAAAAIGFLFTPWGTLIWIGFALGDLLYFRLENAGISHDLELRTFLRI